MTQTPLTNRPAYEPPDRRIRWLAVKNNSGEEIPGYAVMALNIPDGNYFFTTEKKSEQAVFRVIKPGAESEAMQNPAMLLFNGPTPIPKGGWGKGTQDLPAQVLHDGGNDGLSNGLACGPKADSWYIWSSGSAFTCMSHDACVPIGKGDVHTVFLGPGSPNSAGVAQFAAFGGDAAVASGDKIALYSVQQAYGAEIAATSDGIKITTPGIWYLNVAATLSSSVAARGTTLRMRLFVDDTSTSFQGYRLNDVEEDEYGNDILYTAENVCFPAIVDVEKDEVLNFRNGGSYEAAFATLIVTGFRISGQLQVLQGALSFP